jgi:hypothetical protein
MGLRGNVVDLVGVDVGEQCYQPGTVTEVAVVQEELGVGRMRINVEMVDTRGVEG